MKPSHLESFVHVVNELGRTPKGFNRKGRKPEAIFKAIFLAAREDVSEIWEIYTQRREELSRKLISKKQTVVAYLLGFHLANIARAKVLYERSDERHQWKKQLQGKKARIYDLGCGTGALSLALGLKGDYVLIDGSGPLLDAATMLAKAENLTFRSNRCEIENLEPKYFRSTEKEREETVHIYLLGYVWNELARNQPARKKVLSLLQGHIKRNEPCMVFFAEPALEFMARQAMELRDQLCEYGFQMLYPCTHNAPCPMLSRPKDWCYSEATWDQPELAAWVDHKLDLGRSKIASTLMAFASPHFNLNQNQGPVVVGRPVRESGVERYKGFYDYLLCDEDGIEKVKPESPKVVLPRGSIFQS